MKLEGGISKTDPIILTFAGRDTEIAAQKIAQATELVTQYLEGQPKQGAKRMDILAHVRQYGVTVRTLDRTLGELEKLGMIYSPKRGYWEIIPEPQDDISPTV